MPDLIDEVKDENQDSAGGNQDADQKPEESKDTDTPKTFSQEEVNEIVSKRLGETKAKTEEMISKKLQEAEAEWERKAKLTAEEKAKEESERRTSELAQKERDIAIRENRAEARDILAEKKISSELVDWVIDADLDITKSNIEKLEKVWNKAIEEGVNAKMVGKTPTDPQPDSTKQTDEKTSVKDLLYRKKG
ncbi:DUF4355 domain-containing protein [Candidatus Saccharibacteria bacterium]|nr:DUF4355 domain-containing protein [Candidatus Saccharibacteria bacterium]